MFNLLHTNECTVILFVCLFVLLALQPFGCIFRNPVAGFLVVVVVVVVPLHLPLSLVVVVVPLVVVVVLLLLLLLLILLLLFVPLVVVVPLLLLQGATTSETFWPSQRILSIWASF